jgi:hypothetical protein
MLLQQVFKRIDGCKALLCCGIVAPAVHPCYQHVFVMAAVKYLEHAARRRVVVNAPQKIVRKLFFRRHFKRLHAHALRVHAAEHIAYDTVFTAGIHPLQHHQHRVFAFGIK